MITVEERHSEQPPLMLLNTRKTKMLQKLKIKTIILLLWYSVFCKHIIAHQFLNSAPAILLLLHKAFYLFHILYVLFDMVLYCTYYFYVGRMTG